MKVAAKTLVDSSTDHGGFYMLVNGRHIATQITSSSWLQQCTGDVSRSWLQVGHTIVLQFVNACAWPEPGLPLATGTVHM